MTSQLQWTPGLNIIYILTILNPNPPSPPDTPSPTTTSRRPPSIRPATSTARLGGGDNPDLQTISEGSENTDQKSASDERGSPPQKQSKGTVQTPHFGDQLIVTPADGTSGSQEKQHRNLANTVEAWMNQQNGALHSQMSMSEAHKELNIKEQVDNEAILREEMGDNPLITLFSVMEAIEERRETNKALSRPKSAPTNSLHKSPGSIDSDFGVSEYFDSDTSNPALSALEEKLRNFHLKIINDDDSLDKPKITHLRRFNIQHVEPPVAGGTVYVKLKPCKYSIRPESADHTHTRRYILPRLKSYYNSLQISKHY